MNEKGRDFDLVVYGATGFTGRLVAEHLSRAPADGGLKWALAGRDATKLAETAAAIGAEAVPRVIADAADPRAVATLARRTRAIVTTVGPYTKYGAPLIAACVKAGTHYADLCGEPPFMRQSIDAHDTAARKSGARIVHSCGFDSIPFDLGVFYVQRLHREAFGAPATRVDCVVLAMKGGVSGGTAASALATIELAAADPAARRTMQDIYSLAPDAGATRPRQPDSRTPRFDRATGKWVAPFIMADINMRNVHRSNMLMQYAYGEEFQYTEMMAAPNAPAAYAVAGGLLGFAGLMALPPTRAALRLSVLPKPGEGPTLRARETGFYRIQFTARGRNGETTKATVAGDRDPGYGSTSKMLAEAGVALAMGEGKDPRGGVLTPAAAMGDALIERLCARAGLEFGSA